MKRLACIALAAVLLLGLTACGNAQAAELCKAAVQKVQQNGPLSFHVRIESHECRRNIQRFVYDIDGRFSNEVGVIEGQVYVSDPLTSGMRAQLRLQSFNEGWNDTSTTILGITTSLPETYRTLNGATPCYYQDGVLYLSYDYENDASVRLSDLSLVEALKNGFNTGSIQVQIQQAVVNTGNASENTKVEFQVANNSTLHQQMAADLLKLFPRHTETISDIRGTLEIGPDSLPVSLRIDFKCYEDIVDPVRRNHYEINGEHSVVLDRFYYNDTEITVQIPADLSGYTLR